MPQEKKKIILGITGSVAAIKGPELAVRLSKELDAHILILLTNGGQNFWDKAQSYNPEAWNLFSQLVEPFDPLLNFTGEKSKLQIITAEQEWKGWNQMSDPVLHIQLRDWADALIIAPLSAHTLAKISNGMCDETLSCVVRAWDFGWTEGKMGKPLILAPAMNTGMWDHPLTKQQLNIVQGFWNKKKSQNFIKVVEPQVKTLACGEVGKGAMASLDEIIDTCKDVLRL